MLKKLLTLFFVLTNVTAYTQDTLPRFSATGFDKNILITWRNAYQKPIENISIQRSFDSLRHFSTIGSVLNPQSEENGYTDYNPPYERMYYRVFVAFKDGTYLITTPVKPLWMVVEEPQTEITEMPELPENPDIKEPEVEPEEPATFRPKKREPWRVDPLERDKKIILKLKRRKKKL